MGSKLLRLQIDSSFCFGEIGLIDFEADKSFHAATLCSNGGISDAEKEIEHRLDTRCAMQLDAPFRQLHRKRGRMWTLLRVALYRFVANEPGIAAAAQVAAACVRLARNVTLVLIWNTECEPVNLDISIDGEMKNVFVAVVHETSRADRLEVPVRSDVAMLIFDRDRFDPVNGVLQNKRFSQCHRHLVRKHRVRWRRTDIKKK